MIRPFRSGDASACCAILRGCLDAAPAYPPKIRSRLCEAESPRTMTDRAALFYIAVYEEDGRVVGFAGLDLNEIRLLYVDPAQRRRGIGRSLFGHLRAMVPGAMFREMFVYSTPGAVAFYESCGFRNKGPFVFDSAGLSIPTVFMSLPVSSAIRT